MYKKENNNDDINVIFAPPLKDCEDGKKKSAVNKLPPLT